MTNRERIRLLEEFGYSKREAAFLCLAALHSGYFLRRQYASFLGQKRGRPDSHLAQKTLLRKHATCRSYLDKILVYHLSSRPLYTALGDPDNRNRRWHAPFTIRRKLMQLDYVIENRARLYLATEREKVSYFLKNFRVEAAHFPTKIYRSKHSSSKTARYFVDKFPISVSSEQRSSPAVVTFSYIEAGAVSIQGFQTYLDQYRSLLSRLPCACVVYVSGTERHFDSARRNFESLLETLGRDGNGSDSTFVRRLLEFFRLEYLYETKQFQFLDREGLIQLRKARAEFQGERIRSLFSLWKQQGEEALIHELFPPRPVCPRPKLTFSTYRLRHSYGLFGTP